MITTVLWISTFVLIVLGLYFIFVKKSFQLTAVGFLLTVVAIFIPFFPRPSGSFGCITENTEPTTYQTTSFSDSEDTALAEFDIEADDPGESESETEKTDEIAENINIITNDSDVKGSFSNALTEEYVLKSKFRNNYGFKFNISDVNLSYTAFIIDEKGEVVYEYYIGEDSISESPVLEKNTEYTLRVEADEGRPEYTIEIKYPDSDVY
ncbi:MAG: hypothetical protein IJT79_00335 [Ruminococcus sp.]|nr:hypothetical protein [Ruminococcus sp.]